MSRVFPLFLLAGSLLSSAAERPNVIFFMVDDLGWTDFGCYGSDFYETPNIDKLAASGMKFTNGYAACTVCSPTRASLMTGKYTPKHGVTNFIHSKTMKLKHEEITIAEALKEAGYRTAHVGKWHLAPRGVKDYKDYYPTHHGFDINIGGGHWGAPGSYFHPYQGKKAVENIPPGGKKGDFLTDRLTDETLKIINNWKAEPFFVHLAYYAVHTPVMGKPELVKHFADKAPGKVHKKPAYAALLRSVDDSVGRILAELEKLGIAENTLIIITGDNGGLMSQTRNAPLRAGKGSVYEGGVREPTIVRWPGVTPAGSVCDTPVITMDFYPTILKVTGAKGDAAHNKAVDGVDITALLRDPKAKLGRDNLFWYFPHKHGGGARPYASLRHKDMRLVKWFSDNRLELYDLKADISESKNLAKTMPEKAKELDAILTAWLKETNADTSRK
ncbi:MAG: sulfatase [Kiritimatiellia bacterium]|jgi:arylsulfatase A-like enzyme|nr:sulfatase [Kiritimatiellia bacterium]